MGRGLNLMHCETDSPTLCVSVFFYLSGFIDLPNKCDDDDDDDDQSRSAQV